MQKSGGPRASHSAQQATVPDKSRTLTHTKTLPLTVVMAGNEKVLQGSGGDGGDRRRHFELKFQGGKLVHGRGRGRSTSPPHQATAPGGAHGTGGQCAPRGRSRGNGALLQEGTGQPEAQTTEIEAVVPHDISEGSKTQKHKMPIPEGEPKQKKKKKSLRCEMCLDNHFTRHCAML